MLWLRKELNNELNGGREGWGNDNDNDKNERQFILMIETKFLKLGGFLITKQ